MKISTDSVRELIEAGIDELLVVVDFVIFGEIPPREIRRAARRRPMSP